MARYPFVPILLLLTLLASPLRAQTAADRVAVGAEGAFHLSSGSLDGGLGIGGDFFVRWNIIPRVSLIGRMGGGWLRFSPSLENIAAFPDYFGPADTLFYPGTSGEIDREESNATSLTLWSINGTFNLRPDEQLVPYLTLGLGLAAFTPKNAEQGSELPNTARGDVYSSPTFLIPIGVGAEWYLTTELALTAELRHTFSTTDYLDDLDDGGMTDGFTALGIGAAYYVVGELDCDEDGLNDREEKRIGTDPCVPDTDGDRLGDFAEVRTHGTDPLRADSDDDGLDDARELNVTKTNPLREDSDGDGLPDGREVDEIGSDPLVKDTDGDRLDDGAEVDRWRTDPLKPDTDGDRLDDGREVDERTDPLKPDSDDDGLGDGEEVLEHRTNPLKADSDGDELSDGEEVNVYRTDPTNPDTDDDRLADGAEVKTIRTDPLNPDSDGDTVIDGEDACPLVRGVPKRNGCPDAPKVGTITDFPAVYFKKDTDQFDFSREGTTESLAMIMSYVNQCPGLRVLIEGHASREGSDRRNTELSVQRADRVRAWLLERGIDPEKIAGTIGYGSVRNAVDEPAPDSKEAREMNPEKLEAIRRQNRRIAVRVVRSCDD